MVAVRKYYGLLCMLVQWSLYMTRQVFTIAILGEFLFYIEIYAKGDIRTVWHRRIIWVLNLIERYGKTKRYGESKRRNIKFKCYWVHMWSCVRNGLLFSSWFFQVMLEYQNIYKWFCIPHKSIRGKRRQILNLQSHWMTWWMKQ